MSFASGDSQPTIRNELLSALPPEELERLRPHLQRVTWVIEQELHEAGAPMEYVYFPDSGLVSMIADTGDSGFVEVGMTGREGMVGVAALLNPEAIAVHRALVQIGGGALRIRSDALRGVIEQVPALRGRCLRYLQFLMVQTAQAAACNARHELSERLARWLLMVRDRADGDDVPMTQEFLSYMLGVRRAGVSVIASALQSQGLIQQPRGRMAILDRAGLEKEACSCYRLIEGSRRQIMGGTAPNGTPRDDGAYGTV